MKIRIRLYKYRYIEVDKWRGNVCTHIHISVKLLPSYYIDVYTYYMYVYKLEEKRNFILTVQRYSYI